MASLTTTTTTTTTLADLLHGWKMVPQLVQSGVKAPEDLTNLDIEDFILKNDLQETEEGKQLRNGYNAMVQSVAAAAASLVAASDHAASSLDHAASSSDPSASSSGGETKAVAPVSSIATTTAANATGDAHQPPPYITGSCGGSCGGKHFTNLCADCYASYIEKSNGVAREECDNCSSGTGKLFLPNQLHNVDNNSILCADCKAKHDNEEQDHFNDNDEEECQRCGKWRWSNTTCSCSGRANAEGEEKSDDEEVSEEEKSDDEEDIPEELRAYGGYMKDGFVVGEDEEIEYEDGAGDDESEDEEFEDYPRDRGIGYRYESEEESEESDDDDDEEPDDDDHTKEEEAKKN